jgi:transcriptional regulator with XRE-family HTH domain
MRHKKTASSFVLNTQKAMKVAGRKDDSHPIRMTQAELAKGAGVSRSTLALHKELEADAGRSPNPTLEKICQIAETLNVPPAFLLMRTEDWVRLAQAIDYYANLKASRRMHPFFSKVAGTTNATPTEQAVLGYTLAKMLDIEGSPSDELLESLPYEDRQSLMSESKQRQLNIYATSSLPPINHMQPDEKLASLVVSVIFGAHYKADA